MNQNGWVKIFSETYDDQIVGNRDGLESLRDAIDATLLNKNSDMSEFCKSDFSSVVITDEEWSKTEAEEVPQWQNYIFQFVLAVWVVILPLVGIVSLFNYV